MSLKNSKITVIKIGSSLLIDHKKRVRKKWLTSFAEDVKNRAAIINKFADEPEFTITVYFASFHSENLFSISLTLGPIEN